MLNDELYGQAQPACLTLEAVCKYKFMCHHFDQHLAGEEEAATAGDLVRCTASCSILGLLCVAFVDGVVGCGSCGADVV